ncbi:MAG: hypothetical protein IPO21_15730 [Bacteroidales bacterium]|nr:hypothetical protein [Bacteroidales bacterium]
MFKDYVRSTIVFSDNKNSIVRKFHPRKIIDIVVGFTRRIYSLVGTVKEVELFLFQRKLISFFL